MTEQEQRQAIVAEALTWLKTPYHHMGRMKGVGTDCGMLILQTFENVGLIDHVEIPYYPLDIACHCGQPMYINKIKEYSSEVTGRNVLPGDVVAYQFPGAKVPHHCGIVINAEYLVHAYIRRGVELSNLRSYRKYEYGLFSFWGK